MTIQKFIERAIEGGWDNPLPKIIPNKPEEGCIGEIMTTLMWRHHFPVVALDPLAWKAVGKVEGWEKYVWTSYPDAQELTLKNFTDDENYVPEWKYGSRWLTWKYQMHRMIDDLAEGKSIEQFIETL